MDGSLYEYPIGSMYSQTDVRRTTVVCQTVIYQIVVGVRISSEDKR